MQSSTITLRVRYAETDAMGVAHHSSYIPWLEEARIRWLDTIGLPYRDLEASGVSMPVVELSVKYLKACRFDDTLTIETRLEAPPRARMEVHYRIFRGEETIATASTTLAFITREGRAIKPPSALLEKLGRLCHSDGLNSVGVGLSESPNA